MGIFQDAHATVILADHIAVDGGGKINALGIGFTIVGPSPQGHTPPQCVAAVIDVPAKYAGEQYAVSLELRNLTHNRVVSMPTGQGAGEALRIQQMALASRPQLHGVYVPDVVPCRNQVVLAFTNGLPLDHGHAYRWQLEIDGQTRPGWSAQFYVASPEQGPIFGGPSNPAPTDMPHFGQ